MSWWNSYYSFRKPLELSSVETLAADHIVTLSLDVAAMVSAGKVLSDYSDLEVIFDDGSTATALSREVDDLGIEFNLFQELESTSVSTGEYYLYYGNSLLLDIPTRDAFVENLWPIVLESDNTLISYTRPQEHWIEGRSSTTNALATVSFSGRNVRIKSDTDNDQGIMEVRIDNEPWEEVSLYSLDTDAGAVVYERTELRNGRHTLQIRVSGRKSPSSTGVEVNIVSVDYAGMVNIAVGSEEIKAETVWNTVSSGISSNSGIVIGEQGLTGDTGPGLPAGGTVGQIIVKASTDDYDTEWADDLTPEDWHYVGAVGEPAFENGWTNLGPVIASPLPRLGFRKRAGGIDLNGFLYGASATNGIIFTLPESHQIEGTGAAVFSSPMSADFASTTVCILQTFGKLNGLAGVVCVTVPGIATGFSGPWPLGVVVSGRFDINPPESIS